MKWLWLLFLIPSICFGAGEVATVAGKADSAIASIMGIAGGSINTFAGKTYNDSDGGYLGVNSTTADSFTAHLAVGNDVAFCRAWTATAAGTLGKAYIRHYGTDTDNAYVWVYNKTGASPAIGDTLVDSSGKITSSTDGWATDDTALGASVTASVYWVCIVGEVGSFDTYKSEDTGASTFSKTVSPGGESPPENLDGTWTETANREYAVYLVIE